MSKTISPFTTEFLEQIHVLLKEEETRLSSELSRFNSKPTDSNGDTVMPDYGEKDDENALEVAEFTANKPLEMTLEKTLRDVLQSLERLKKDGYGICKYCEKPIDEKRLLARPTSSACVSCKKSLTDEA